MRISNKYPRQKAREAPTGSNVCQSAAPRTIFAKGIWDILVSIRLEYDKKTKPLSRQPKKEQPPSNLQISFSVPFFQPPLIFGLIKKKQGAVHVKVHWLNYTIVCLPCPENSPLASANGVRGAR